MGDFGKSLVKLNVGGTVYETRLETLDRGSKQGSQVRKSQQSMRVFVSYMQCTLTCSQIATGLARTLRYSKEPAQPANIFVGTTQHHANFRPERGLVSMGS